MYADTIAEYLYPVTEDMARELWAWAEKSAFKCATMAIRYVERNRETGKSKNVWMQVCIRIYNDDTAYIVTDDFKPRSMVADLTYKTSYVCYI